MENSLRNVSTAKILRQMALGNDPATGLPLPEEHMLHRSEVIRALVLATEAIESINSAKTRSERPPRAGAPWTDAEDKELESMINQGESVNVIARSFQRSIGSITSRLEKLGVFDDFQVILENARAERRS